MKAPTKTKKLVRGKSTSPEKRNPKPAGAPSRKKKTAPEKGQPVADKHPPQVPASRERSQLIPCLSNSTPALIKFIPGSDEAPYESILPLIKLGRTLKKAQRKGGETISGRKAVRRENFIRIFREKEATAGVNPKRTHIFAAAREQFAKLYGEIAESTAWGYLKGLK